MCGTKTMKRLFLPIAAAVLLAGCGDDKVYDLPGNAVEFEQTACPAENAEGQISEYETIVFGGKNYYLYGVNNGRFSDSDVARCVGFTDREQERRVCTLAGTDDYIMKIYIGSFRDEPVFYRAGDTVGEEIYTPDYIRCTVYELWGAEPG